LELKFGEKTIQLVAVKTYQRVNASAARRIETVTGMPVYRLGYLQCFPAQWVERSCHMIPVWADQQRVKSSEELRNHKGWYLLNNHHDRWSYWSLYRDDSLDDDD